jgi:hypothetical protein
MTQSDNSAIRALFADLKPTVAGCWASTGTPLAEGRRRSDAAHDRAAPGRLCHDLRADAVDPDRGSQVLPGAGAGLSPPAIRHRFRAWADPRYRALRELRPRISRFPAGRVQGRLGPRAQESMRRSPNRDHRRRWLRSRGIADCGPGQHVRSRAISARPARPVAPPGSTTDPRPGKPMPGVNSSGQKLSRARRVGCRGDAAVHLDAIGRERADAVAVARTHACRCFHPRGGYRPPLRSRGQAQDRGDYRRNLAARR